MYCNYKLNVLSLLCDKTIMVIMKVVQKSLFRSNCYSFKKGELKVYEKHLEVEIEEGNNYFCVYLEYSNFRVINCDTFRIIYCYTC